jgi:hypothetical protein
VSLCELFCQNNPSQLKQYQECLATRLVLRCPQLLREVLLPLMGSYQTTNPGLGSVVLVAAQVLFRLPEQEQVGGLRAPVWLPHLLLLPCLCVDCGLLLLGLSFSLGA